MKYIYFFFLVIFGFSAFGQKKQYYDENFKVISHEAYKEKCKGHLYKCFEYKTDSFAINKILIKYKFGKLDSVAYQQVRNLLIRDSSSDIPEQSTLVIKYYDSIFGFETENKKYTIHERKHLESEKDTSIVINYHEFYFNKEIFNTNRQKWVDNRKKCLKKFDGKYNTKIFHMYKHKDIDTEEYNNFEWIGDKGTFKNVFFQIMYNYGLVILKPNGEYFLSGGHLSDKSFNKLIKNSNWLKYQNDLHKSLTSHNVYGKGMFSKDVVTHKNKHCF